MPEVLEQDHYAILGVSQTAMDRDIKKAFRKLSLAIHPDKHMNDSINHEAAEYSFKKLSAAYEVLFDTDKRLAYDTMCISIRNSRHRLHHQTAKDIFDAYVANGRGVDDGVIEEQVREAPENLHRQHKKEGKKKAEKRKQKGKSRRKAAARQASENKEEMLRRVQEDLKQAEAQRVKEETRRREELWADALRRPLFEEVGVWMGEERISMKADQEAGAHTWGFPTELERRKVAWLEGQFNYKSQLDQLRYDIQTFEIDWLKMDLADQQDCDFVAEYLTSSDSDRESHPLHHQHERDALERKRHERDHARVTTKAQVEQCLTNVSELVKTNGQKAWGASMQDDLFFWSQEKQAEEKQYYNETLWWSDYPWQVEQRQRYWDENRNRWEGVYALSEDRRLSQERYIRALEHPLLSELRGIPNIFDRFRR